MKLTGHGSDYHLAIVALAALGIVTGYTLFAGTALALAVASTISLALLGSRAPRTLEVEALGPSVRVFKNEEGRMTLRVPGLRGSWANVRVEKATVAGPVGAEVVQGHGGEPEVIFRPRLAGRFSDVAVELGLEDALGLFSMRRRVKLPGVAIDSLPYSLLDHVRRAFMPSLVVGERPAGTRGKGQEFFGIENYTERSESRDILWKRAAKEPGRPLLARVREAENPEWVTLKVVHRKVEPASRERLVDLQCEALGALGRALILAGVGTEIAGPDGAAHRAVDDEELADAVMLASAAGPPEVEPAGHPGKVNVLVLVGEPGDELLDRHARTPVVVIGDGVEPPRDVGAVRFTGFEDLTGVVNQVVAG